MFRGFWGSSLIKPPFRVVVIICPNECLPTSFSHVFFLEENLKLNQQMGGKKNHVGPQNRENLAVLLVTFLGWLSDLQRSGIKRSRIESTGTTIVPRPRTNTNTCHLTYRYCHEWLMFIVNVGLWISLHWSPIGFKKERGIRDPYNG